MPLNEMNVDEQDERGLSSVVHKGYWGQSSNRQLGPNGDVQVQAAIQELS